MTITSCEIWPSGTLQAHYADGSKRVFHPGDPLGGSTFLAAITSHLWPKADLLAGRFKAHSAPPAPQPVIQPQPTGPKERPPALTQRAWRAAKRTGRK